MDHEWHYVRDGETVGPVSMSALTELVSQGVLQSEDLVWRIGLDEWVSIASINLAPPVAIPPPIPGTSRPATSASQPPKAMSQAKVERPARRHQPHRNANVAVWSGVGIVAILLCVGWAIMSQPSSPPSRSRTPDHRRLATPQQDPIERTKTVPPKTVPRNEAPDPSLHTKSITPAPVPSTTSSPISKVPAVETPTAKTVNARQRPGPQRPAPAPKATSSRPLKQTLFQFVDIRREPTFSIQGLETKQSLHYQVVSQLDVEQNAATQTTSVVQIVDDVKLVAADASSRDGLARALNDLKRQQYTFRLNRHGEVIEFTGHKKNRMTIPLDFASSKGFQLTSVIDEDGWKELAELTFLVPPGDQAAQESWQRQMTHDWGALGRWSGVTTFTKRPSVEHLLPITFARQMKYTAPEAGDGGLPFRIQNAAFEIQQAAGTIEFDKQKRRVQRATENFDVRGVVTAGISGVEIQIELSEQQRIEIRLSEQRPSLQ